MIRVILILLVVIVFLLVSALPLLIGEKCVWKNDENRQKEYALKVVKQVLSMVFRLTGSTLTVKEWRTYRTSRCCIWETTEAILTL